MVLSIDRLTKTFGNKIAVDNLSMEMRPGVYGLVGANGAGKTTLMRMISAIPRSRNGDYLILPIRRGSREWLCAVFTA